ncbi:hypothetical protein BJP40_22330 [Streptomyces sp. CC53]|uniref:hypothetical protein n=1 Tax=Streptomyces sp. C8S0 TaxID=2585716 RepID=UPI0008DE74FC|nr:hypothetical protein BJP40_22330 [Streptomyces sp. CC53]
MLLRDVEGGGLGAYVRMRCDPAVMDGLGGPLPREGMEAKVRRAVHPPDQRHPPGRPTWARFL